MLLAGHGLLRPAASEEQFLHLYVTTRPVASRMRLLSAPVQGDRTGGLETPMQDLTNDPQTGAKAHLSPSSMSGSNTVYADPSLAQTAPGSPGVIPNVEVVDNLPLPLASPGASTPNGERPERIPVGWPPRAGESAVVTNAGRQPQAWKGWTKTDGRPWGETP